MAPLCRPRPNLSCFRCCPPIRPAGHDHLDHRHELSRRFRANTAGLESNLSRPRPISGRFCWALGHLDREGRLIGCLLHPALNQGRDLRQLTGYGAKCARETCPQAQVFAGLDPDLAGAALDLIGPLDSFEFSSPKANPLWRLLLWGGPVLSLTYPAWTAPGSPLGAYLAGHPEPRARAYLLAGLTRRLGRPPSQPDRFEAQAERLVAELRPVLTSPLADQPFVHRLSLEPELGDFLRLGLGLNRLEAWRAEELAGRLEAALDRWAAGHSST